MLSDFKNKGPIRPFFSELPRSSEYTQIFQTTKKNLGHWLKRTPQNTQHKNKRKRTPLAPTRMNVRVLLHVGLLVEPLAAVLARIGPRVRMNEQVRGERARPLEALAALAALEAALVLVRRPVVLQTHQVTEVPVARLALERPLLAGVGAPRVHLQAVRRAEPLLAPVTLILASPTPTPRPIRLLTHVVRQRVSPIALELIVLLHLQLHSLATHTRLILLALALDLLFHSSGRGGLLVSSLGGLVNAQCSV